MGKWKCYEWNTFRTPIQYNIMNRFLFRGKELANLYQIQLSTENLRGWRAGYGIGLQQLQRLGIWGKRTKQTAKPLERSRKQADSQMLLTSLRILTPSPGALRNAGFRTEVKRDSGKETLGRVKWSRRPTKRPKKKEVFEKAVSLLSVQLKSHFWQQKQGSAKISPLKGEWWRRAETHLSGEEERELTRPPAASSAVQLRLWRKWMPRRREEDSRLRPRLARRAITSSH